MGKRKGESPPETESLRRRAEKKLPERGGEVSLPRGEFEMQRLIHELQVHQLELEMQNEELLRANLEAETLRQRYQDLYEFSPIGYVTLDAQGVIRQANLTGASLLGCVRESLSKRALASFLAADSCAEFELFRRRCLEGGKREWCEVRFGPHENRDGWLLLEGEAIADGERGESLRVGFMDISGRKVAEAALRKSEERFSRIFNATPCLISITTLADGRFIDINEAGLRVLGYRREEVVGKTAHDLGIWADPSDRENMVRIVEAQGSVRNFSMNFRGKSGETFAGLYSADLIDLEGQRFLLGVVQDVTEMKRAEEEIRLLSIALEERAARLETANRDLEAFGYSVTHDLRRPLTMIFSAAQLLAHICGHGEGECVEVTEMITGGCRDMERMIEAIFSLSRSSVVSLKRARTDLTGLALTVAAGLKLSRTERKCRFVIPAGLVADCDPDLVKIVICNLLNNAWKFTSQRDKAIIEFGETVHDGEPAFFVRDNGIGFSMSEAPVLFDPFQRTAAGREFKGHGIGLATVRKIVERHGGRIWAVGKAGKGATFFFTLQSRGGGDDGERS